MPAPHARVADGRAGLGPGPDVGALRQTEISRCVIFPDRDGSDEVITREGVGVPRCADSADQDEAAKTATTGISPSLTPGFMALAARQRWSRKKR